jgi:hypothetical protein
VVVATKDRPQELGNLISRLADLKNEFSLVVVADSSASQIRQGNEELIRSMFADGEFYFLPCDVASLTVQKNKAFDFLANLKPRQFEAIQILDDDTLPSPGFLSRMLETLKNSCAVGVSGITSDLPASLNQNLVRKIALLFGLEGPQGKISNGGIGMAVTSGGRQVEAEWLIGCSMWHTDVLDYRYCEKLIGSALFEDLEFSSRIPGLKIVNPGLVLYHQSSSVNRPDPYIYWFRFARNRYLLVETGTIKAAWYYWCNLGVAIQIMVGMERQRALSLRGLAAGTVSSLLGRQFL